MDVGRCGVVEGGVRAEGFHLLPEIPGAIVAGAAAERTTPYEKTIKKQKDTLKFFTRDQLGFGYATFTEDAITIDFLDENSESLYSYRIN